MKRATIILAALLLGSAAETHAGTGESIEDRGRQLLEKNCSRSHAIGEQGTSPHFKAPPFRNVVKKYPPENLAEALAEGIVSGHPDMPEFVFQPIEINAIITYLDNLKVTTGK